MTIELRVPFFEKADAVEFQRYLKKNGCSGRLETILDFHKTMRYSATIGALEQFLDDVENPDVEKAREVVNNYKKYIADFYAKCEVGVEYSLIDDILHKFYGLDTKFLTADFDEMDFDEQEKQDETMAEISHLLAAVICLEMNGCVINGQQSKTVTLTQKKPVEELVISVVGNEVFGGFNPEDMENAGISISMQTVVGNRYTVIAGPEYITMDLDGLIDYLSEYEDDEDGEDNDVIIHVRMCSILIHRIMEIISNGQVSISELIEKLFASSKDIPVTFDVLEDALQDILNDMKKLGFISIKNGFVKLTR